MPRLKTLPSLAAIRFRVIADYRLKLPPPSVPVSSFSYRLAAHDDFSPPARENALAHFILFFHARPRRVTQASTSADAGVEALAHLSVADEAKSGAARYFGALCCSRRFRRRVSRRRDIIMRRQALRAARALLEPGITTAPTAHHPLRPVTAF